MKGRANGNDAGGTKVDRAWSALRADLKHELLAPVAGLLQYGRRFPWWR